MKKDPLLPIRINRFWIVSILLLLQFLIGLSMLMAEEKVRPLNLVTPAERNMIYEMIDSEVVFHQQNPDEYLKLLPPNWLQNSGEKLVYQKMIVKGNKNNCAYKTY